MRDVGLCPRAAHGARVHRRRRGARADPEHLRPGLHPGLRHPGAVLPRPRHHGPSSSSSWRGSPSTPSSASGAAGRATSAASRPRSTGAPRSSWPGRWCPLLIVVVLFLVTARYIYGIERRAMPPGALEVTVVGHQWWWEIRYPGARDRHRQRAARPGERPGEPDADLPHAPVRRRGPQLLGAPAGGEDGRHPEQDEPRVDRSADTRAPTSASAPSTAALQHAWMLLRVVVHPRDEFDRWVAAQQAPARDDPAVRAGSRALPLARLHQLPHGARHARQRRVRAGPHASDEPAHPRGRGRAAIPRRTCARGWTTRRRSSPGR